jgi:type IV secretory pathway VirB10-like protein
MKSSISRHNRLSANHRGAKALRATFAAMIGAAVIVGCTGHAAWAEDDEDDLESKLIDKQIMRHILKGLGFQRDEKGIEYRERSPLVLPGNSKELPKPAPATPAAKTAGWPDDPDIKRQKQRRDEEKNRKAYVEGVDDRPLLPSEYAKKKGAEDKNRPNILDSKSSEDSQKPSTNQELGSKGIFSNLGKLWGDKSQEYVTFTGEPPRSTLIEPPRGYRTPSPNQPYGVGPEKWTGPRQDRQEPVR